MGSVLSVLHSMCHSAAGKILDNHEGSTGLTGGLQGCCVVFSGKPTPQNPQAHASLHCHAHLCCVEECVSLGGERNLFDTPGVGKQL
jgi:hypothetical protein